MRKRIMGFDASTTTIGSSVFDWDKEINFQYVNFYKPPKEGDLFERLSEVRSFIHSILDEFKPDEVALEDIILANPGKTSVNTISLLAVLNRTVGLAAYDYLKKPPNLLNIMKIRHAVKLNKDLPKKEEIPALMEKQLNIEFPYILNRKGKPKEECFDMADAMAVGLAYIKIQQKLENPPVKKKKSS